MKSSFTWQSIEKNEKAIVISKLREVWKGLFHTWPSPPDTPAEPLPLKPARGARTPSQASAARLPGLSPVPEQPPLFSNLPLPITPAIRKRMKADAARLLAASAQPTAAQWKMIFSGAISTCVVAGAGSGKSSSLALRVVLLTHYLGIELADISVVTFTRASREDFAARLVSLLGLWGHTITLDAARARVTTFHAMVLAWARTLPGFAQVQAFESLGNGKASTTAYQLRVTDAQRELLNGCYQALCQAEPSFRALVQALRIRSVELPKLSTEHADVKRRFPALLPAAERDLELTQLIESHWRQAGRWPVPGIDAVHSQHKVLGQVFHCHGYLPASNAWIVLGADPSMAMVTRAQARMSIQAEWAVKRTLFQAFFDKPLIWLDSFTQLEVISSTVEGPGIDYCLSVEGGAQPLLDACVSVATFIENLGLDVPTASRALASGEDGLFFQLLERFWPAFEQHLLTQSPPVLTYNRLFGVFSDPKGSALRRLPIDKLTGMRHLLVDELQDIAPQIATWLQSGMRERLRRDAQASATLMCVGDDWQSIYGWRGSAPAYFIDFAKVFPAPLARRVILADNFRNTQQIIDCAEYMVRGAASIPGKRGVAAKTGLQVQLLEKDFIQITQLIDNAIDSRKRVLLLFRQAKDDPRHIPHIRKLLDADPQGAMKGGSLRCMTIHASKGLEADIVILLGDCTARPASAARNRLYELAGMGSHGSSVPYDRAQAQEALRLAYVGMTRAAEAVYWYVEPEGARAGQVSAMAHAASSTGLFDDRRE
jgi:hypothetical protein